MKTMNLQQLGSVVGGVPNGKNVSFEAISTDTRTVNSGDLFVALQGENFDANQFVKQAADKGSIAALIDSDTDVAIPYVKVEDTLTALTDLARNEREKTDIPVVAITGSNGKTSVKELLASILRQSMPVLATEGNFNNQIGVPLTLLKLTAEHQVAVIEMGASKAGDIRHLCGIAKPTVAVLNNVAAAHIEGFGDIEGVAAAKGEIITGLIEGGTVVLNRDEPWFNQWAELAANKTVVSFGLSSAADVWADMSSANTGLVDSKFATSFTMNYQGDRYDVRLNLIGEHNIVNALAASAAAFSLGVLPSQILDGIAALEPVKGRMQPLQGVAGSVVINDCYNANPKSFDAALASLADVTKPVWLVLGDFAELGADSGVIHQQIGKQIAGSYVQRVFAVGDDMQVAVSAFNEAADGSQRTATHYEDKACMAEKLAAELTSDVVVLVKGSRSQGLESVIEKITVTENAPCY